MTNDDEDLRAVFDAAHEAAPPIERVLAQRPRRRWVAPIVLATAGATVVTVLTIIVAWPARAPSGDLSSRGLVVPDPAAEVAIDLSAAELRSIAIVTPLDSLLEVPGLASLHTLPTLGVVPTVSDPGGLP